MYYGDYLYNYSHRYFSDILPEYRAKVTDRREMWYAEGVHYAKVGEEIHRKVFGYLEKEAGAFLTERGARLYQLAFAVDLMPQILHLHIETREHAAEMAEQRAQDYLSTGNDPDLACLFKSPQNLDPNSFLFRDAARLEISSLEGAHDVYDPAALDLVDIHVEYLLVCLVNDIRQHPVLAPDHPARIPREPQVWLGITTHRFGFGLAVEDSREEGKGREEGRGKREEGDAVGVPANETNPKGRTRVSKARTSKKA